MKDFLYIKPQKTGTKSVRLSLSRFTDNNQGIKITNKNSDSRGHRNFLQYKKIFNNSITKDTILIMSIRNPFDRIVSWYFDTIKRRFHEFDYKSISFVDAVQNKPEWVSRLPQLSYLNKVLKILIILGLKNSNKTSISSATK